MANSPLDLVNSDAFRKKLITRNLTPYAKAPNRPSLPTNIEYIQSDVSVQDSPDQLIDEPSLANQLYPLNRWGAEGGFKQVPDPGALTNNKSNQGEYGPGQQDAHIIDQAQIEQYNWKPINAYSNGTQEVLDSGEYITEPDFIRSGTPNLYNNQPYPTTFVPSSYAPVSILLNPDPLGNNGLLSQDSFLAQLGAKTLKKEFQDRIALNIYQNTLGRANLFNVDSGTDILNLVTTRVPLIEPNWTITVPENPVLAAADFALRLAGSIIPISPIPGSYFDTSITLGQPTTIQQIQNAFRQSNTGVGKFFSRLLGADRTGTQIFLNNTGGGQKSRLFGNLKFNRYKPGYDRNVFDRLAGVLVGARENNSNYYIGSVTSEPSRVFSPAGDLPVSPFGAEMQSPVYGPTELAQLYEGPNREIRLGANAPAYIDGGGLEGGLTWVSPKYRNNAGKKVGLGGEVTNPDENFRPSSYVTTESTNIEFRTGSIMDDTQRLIDSQPNGGRRLQHVGNAIDQVSKVFHDGYKEMTKGSRVLSYVGSLGQEVGTEYCRVFAKDLPYSQYSDLQKTNGVVNEGRRFSYSVFDKTYNLNMYPNKQEGGQDSSNLIGTGAQSYAKKYMFSLENLAWRTSHTPGINVNDLPICERGPNGGRVMWFPPYALSFSENSRANWKENDFLGRPEKIYTYTNSSRDGSISWKIVVDHPSILNVIVNKVLSNANNSERINGLLDSFFAGCKKYDLYELAKKYYTISPNELAVLQQIVSSKQASKEVVGAIRNSQASGALNTGGQSQNTTQPVQQTASETFKQFENLALFFPNAQPVPPPSTVAPYSSYYTTYEAQVGGVYKGESENFFNNIVKSNYDEINVKFIDQLSQYLKDNPASVVSIFLQATASKPADDAYNLRLSERRNESVIKFFSENPKLKQYVDNRRLTFPAPEALGESGEVFQYDGTRFISNVKTEKCSNYQPNDITNNDSTNPNITNQIAMACRRVTIKKIQVSSPQTVQQPSQANLPSTQGGIQSTPQNRPIGQAEIEPKFRKADWITKRIVRNLISECDYFETIKEETPMVYDNLKQKLKFFQPGFHSTTPEGLNSRLTFLQQCLRPGDTIPTVNPQPNGSYQLDFNNAVNTAFGLPPVLVLRIGDFYHTKIIPTTLQLQFEGLDINPEGIGIQPMIANVTLGFNFVGGQGLKNAIDKLQNGLSFNFYANTEMWDERADATDMDNLKVISKDFLQMVQNPSAPTTNQTQNTNGLSNATTIGNKVSSSIATTGETGVMSYTEFMDTIITQSQTYFQTMFNQSKSTFNQYNNAILQQWSLDNIYQQGDLLCNPSLVNGALLFGKNDNFQKNIDTIFSDLLDDIKNKDDRFIEYINSQGVNFSDKAIRIITENYTNYINNKKSTYSNALTKLIQDTTTNQQSFIQYLSRLNTVLYIPPAATINGTDGYQQKNGVIIVYNLKQKTNEYTELVNDGAKIGQALFDYYNVLKSKTDFRVGDKSYSGFLAYWDNSSNPQSLTNEVFNPFSKALLFGEKPFRRQYAILSNDLKSENYNNFKAAIVGQLIVNPSLGGKTGKDNFSEVFDNYWNKKAKPLFDEENSLTNTFLDTIEKDKLGNFLNFTPYPLGKVREFTFERDDTPDSGQKKLIKSLGALNNSNRDKKSWNSLDGANIYISKVKLN